MGKYRVQIVSFLLIAILAMQAAPIFGQGDGGLIDDFEGGDFEDRWWSSTEAETASFTCAPDQPGYDSGYAMGLAFERISEYADCGLDIEAASVWAGAGGLSFVWRADQPGLIVNVVVEVIDPSQPNPESLGVTPFVATLETPDVWMPVMLPWDRFAKAEWIGNAGIGIVDPASVILLYFGVEDGQSGSVWIDDLRLIVDRAMPELSSPVVNDFLYQLQGIDLAAVGETDYDLVVMDYSRDGTGDGAYTAAQIDALRHSPGGDKILLAYMSIGEAEDYRTYWQESWTLGDPAWLDGENPDWEGNYKVHYWDPDWQVIIFGAPESYLDQIIAAGFDGVYLDIIDGYNYYEDQGRETAAREMADFVIALAEYARERHPGFLIFPQNAVELASYFPDYLATIDGVGQEDIFYGYPDEGHRSPPDFVNDLTPYLDLLVDAGKIVLATAYTTDSAQIADHYNRARDAGYVPFATVRDLDQLVINSGFEPD